MKRILTGLLVLCLLMALAVPALAAGDSRITDDAGLFTEDELAQLESLAASYASVTELDFAVLTLDSRVSDPDRYAQNFFQNNHGVIGSEYWGGVLLYINMEDRDVIVGAYADAMLPVSLTDCDTIRNRITSLYLSDGEYFQAARLFLALTYDEVKSWRDAGSPEHDLTPSDYEDIEGGYQDYEYDYQPRSFLSEMLSSSSFWLMALVIAVIMMLIVNGINKKGFRQGAPAASLYVDNATFVMNKETDKFLRTHTKRTAIPKDNGGSSSSSGRSSSGGSSRSGGGHSSRGKF